MSEILELDLDLDDWDEDENFEFEKAPTVLEHLAKVSYGADSCYVPSQFAVQFVDFIKQVNGQGGESHKSPVVHYKMLDTISNGEEKIINMCHRGMAKTTVMGEYLYLYIAVYNEIPGFGDVDLCLYVSDSIENGVKNMRKNLEHRWENSDFLQFYLPKKGVKFTDVRWEFTNLDGKKTIVKGYGAKTGVRGAKEMGKRPQLAVLDDLVSDEDARSATVIEAIEATVNKAVNFALDPEHNMTIWSGTPFNARDPLYKAVESGAWAVNVFPICERFPCKRADFNGSWEDRFTYDYVLKQYKFAARQGKVKDFNQELMLSIMSDEDRLIQDSEIKWYERKLLMRKRAFYNFYVTTDFATSEAQAADFSVISVWAYNANGDWFWVDGMVERQDMGKNIDKLFDLCQKYKPQQVGIEISGQQKGFIPWIQREMINRNQFFVLASENNKGAPGIRPVSDKMVRFNVIVPQFKLGKIYYPTELRADPRVVEHIAELSLASPSGFRSVKDDCIDTISMLTALTPWKPSVEIEIVYNEGTDLWEDEDDDEVDSPYASYVV